MKNVRRRIVADRKMYDEISDEKVYYGWIYNINCKISNNEISNEDISIKPLYNIRFIIS